jgi:tellurite resistance protein TehA-like permease
MTHNVSLVANYMALVGLVTNLVLLALQFGAYRKTKHSSLAVMAVATTIALLNVLAFGGARAFWAPSHIPLAFYVAMASLLSIQSVMALLGLRWLFRAFEQALAPGDGA